MILLVGVKIIFLTANKFFIWIDTDCGLVQWSTLSRNLFILYINDMTKESNLVESTIYANDTSLAYTKKNAEETIPVLNNDLLRVYVWLREKKNFSWCRKANFMIFHKIKTVLVSMFTLFCQKNVHLDASMKLLTWVLQ